MQNTNQDPAEGSRATIERELNRAAGPAQPGSGAPAEGSKNPNGEFQNPAPMDPGARPHDPAPPATDPAGQQGSTRHGRG